MSRQKEAVRHSTGAAAGMALLLMALSLPQSAGAQNGKLPPVSPEKVMSIGDYSILRNMATLGKKADLEVLTYFLIGLRVTLVAGSEAYVVGGAKQRVCIPPEIRPGDLLEAINEEFDRDEAYWKARRNESVVPLMLAAFAKSWPCK